MLTFICMKDQKHIFYSNVALLGPVRQTESVRTVPPVFCS